MRRLYSRSAIHGSIRREAMSLHPPGGSPPPDDPGATTGSLGPTITGQMDAMDENTLGGRIRRTTAWGPGGWGRRTAKLWGFLGFAILVLVLARHVLLTFIFALLVAYIFAPIVNRMSRA